MTQFDVLKSELSTWLFGTALPLWSEAGIDPANGGFEEVLGSQGRPVGRTRRARVQARQIYVFAWAGEQGWAGDWQGAVRGGYDYFKMAHLRTDGLFRTASNADGSVADDDVLLYDQAFALFACASIQYSLPECRADAAAVAGRLLTSINLFRHPGGGFAERGNKPFQSNPHMHLLEASLAWESLSDDRRWSDLADEIGGLALKRFIDPRDGFLREFFDSEWRPAEGVLGQIVEPGHQFEWAWLLDRWGQRRGDLRAQAAARRLYAIGADYGIDTHRKVAVDQLDDEMRPLTRTGRLWPQTERLRAAVRFGDIDGAVEAASILKRYVDRHPAGLWWDKLLADDSFIDEDAPASSLYHIVGAIDSMLDF